MKVFHNKSMIGLLSLVLLAGSALAQGGPPEHKFGRGGFRGGPMSGMFLHRLDLTDAQKAQVKQIMTQERATLKPLMQQMAQGRTQLRQLALSGSFSEDQARSIAMQQSQNMTELMVQRARIENEVFQVLTPDQKTKLTQLLQERAERFANRGRSQGQGQDSTTTQ